MIVYGMDMDIVYAINFIHIDKFTRISQQQKQQQQRLLLYLQSKMKPKNSTKRNA